MSDQDRSNAAGSAGGFWLTDVLQSDVTVLRMAGEQLGAATDTEAGALAARRSLDGQLRAMSGWPRPEDYARMAADYEAAGRVREAALLRQVATTEELRAEARARWNHRYTDRPAGTADEMIAKMADGGMIDFDPDGPLRGLDGAAYQPGMLTFTSLAHPVVLVASRAGLDFAVDWADYAAMSAWIAGRGSTAGGALDQPPTPYGHRFRPWREEQVLARMLEAPDEVPVLAAKLPPDTFTADVRYDIYAAILAVHNAGLRVGPEHVAAELGSRLAWLPDHALPLYGGPAGRTAHAYLSRLAASSATYIEAIRAAHALHEEDAQNRARGLTRSAEHTGDPGPKPQRVPEQANWLLLSGQAMPDSRTTSAAPVIMQEELPPVRRTRPLDPGLRPPEQPQPGGPVIRT
jgi:DnaB-like helicase N terminal domain